MATKKWLQFCKLYALLVVGFALKWIKCKIIPLNFGNNKWSCQSNSHDCHFDINNRCGCSLDHQQQSILFALFADHFKCARLLSPNQSGGPISPGDFWFSWWWRKQYSSCCCLNYPTTTQNHLKNLEEICCLTWRHIKCNLFCPFGLFISGLRNKTLMLNSIWIAKLNWRNVVLSAAQTCRWLNRKNQNHCWIWRPLDIIYTDSYMASSNQVNSHAAIMQLHFRSNIHTFTIKQLQWNSNHLTRPDLATKY